MIFVDANIFLRYLTYPDTDRLKELNRISVNFLDRVQHGDIQATTSEVVLHEVCFVLMSPQHYANRAVDVIQAMREILLWPGWVFPADDHAVYLRALDLWERHPRLEFSDAVIAARYERGDYELASFDRHFDLVSTLNRWPMTTNPADGA